MAGPCVVDSETVVLTVVGSPGSLHAEAREVSNTFSATQGDALPHTVTDAGVDHVQTRTIAVPNPLADSPVTGIVVCKFDPIIVTDWSADLAPVWSAELIIGGVTQDQFQSNDVTLDSADTPAYLQCVIPALLGQIDIAAGGSTSVTFRKTVTNNATSQTWTFVTNGDKMVVQLGP